MSRHAYFSKIIAPVQTDSRVPAASGPVCGLMAPNGGTCVGAASESVGAGPEKSSGYLVSDPADAGKAAGSGSAGAGVALIEILVYFLLLIFLGVLLFQGATALQTRMRVADGASAVNMSLHAAADALSRDLRVAPAQTAGWQKLGPSEIQWRTQTAEFDWYAEGGRLYRAQKKYNPLKKEWSDRAVSVVATGITSLLLQPVLSTDDTPQVIKVMFTLEHGQRAAVRGVVAMRNRNEAA